MDSPMPIYEKYKLYKEIFYKYFVYTGKGPLNYTEKGSFIPAAAVRFEGKDQKSAFVDISDGTINMADYLSWLYVRYLSEEKSAVEGEIYAVLSSLVRLCDGAYEYFHKNYPNINFPKESGFFLRDDIGSKMTDKFNTKEIWSGFSKGIERIQEDPCFSPFVSQDQIWNLLPILSVLEKEFKSSPTSINLLCWQLIQNILRYVVKNKHTIYNPYYSVIKHYWTYLNLKVPYENRIRERDLKLKYDIKVKRGANNWYYAYGFRKTLDRFSKKKCNQWKTFWYGCLYYPLIFLADKVYFPFMERTFGLQRKDNSYHCLGVSGEVWYSGRKSFLEHLKKKFNKDLSYSNVLFLEASKQNNFKGIDQNKIQKYLEDYPEPSFDGTMQSPLQYLTMFDWYVNI